MSEFNQIRIKGPNRKTGMTNVVTNECQNFECFENQLKFERKYFAQTRHSAGKERAHTSFIMSHYFH